MTEPSHTAHDFFRFRYEAIRVIVRDAVKRLQETERLASNADPEAVAALVYASWDGLRTQWMYDPGVDVRMHWPTSSSAWGSFRGSEPAPCGDRRTATSSASGTASEPGPLGSRVRG